MLIILTSLWLLIPVNWRISVAEGLTCFQIESAEESSEEVGYGTLLKCPDNVNSCYKYVCNAEDDYTLKGCFNPQLPELNCQLAEQHCRQKGGLGTCYICRDDDYCNGELDWRRGRRMGALEAFFTAWIPLQMMINIALWW